MENGLLKDITQFAMTRVDRRPVTNEVKEQQKITFKMIEDITSILAKANITTFGAASHQIHENIYNPIMDLCCRYQEDGFLKGFTDGYDVAKYTPSSSRA